MKFFNIAKCFTLPTLTDVANIYNDEIQKGNMVYDVNERIKIYNITACFTLPTLTDVANIYNDNNDEIQKGNIIEEGIIVSGVI